MKRIDAHAQVYSNDDVRYPPVENPTRPPGVSGSFSSLTRLAAENDASKICVVQPSSFYGWDNRFACDLALAEPGKIAVICRLNPEDTTSPASVALLKRQCGVQVIRSLPASNRRIIWELPWEPEVRQAASEEDLIRRLQSAISSPLAQVDCWFMKSPPWKQWDGAKNDAGELLESWEKLGARCREIIGWRMQMVPYLKAAFHRYADDGTPPFRALVLDDRKSKKLYTVDDQYLIGDRMMVAPLFAGEPDRKVVFPEGEWHDFWTGEKIAGGTELTVPASTEKIPAYVKSIIVPWADVGLYTGTPGTPHYRARLRRRLAAIRTQEREGCLAAKLE